MDVQTINAIAGLWPLGLVVVAGIAILVLREPLRAILQTIVDLKFKRGDTEFAMNWTKKEDPTVSKAAEVEPIPQEAGILTEAETSIVVREEGNLYSAYFKAVADKDLSALRDAYNILQHETPKDTDKIHIDAMHYFILYAEFADGTALRKLLLLANGPEANASVKSWVAQAYEKAGDHEQAAEWYEKSSAIAKDDEQRATGLSRAAYNLFLGGKERAALAKLLNAIRDETSKEAQSHLFEGLASIYQKANEPLLRALAMEKALEGRPNNATLRFLTAFNYSHVSFSRLAILHYQSQLSFFPNDVSSLNNVGVELGRQNIGSKAIRAYRNAAERGETLAMANLASIYIGSGFLDEAAELLNRARALKDVHSRVGSVMADLNTREEEDNEKLEKSLSVAREQQSFLKAFARAAFVPSKRSRGGSSFAGRWKLPSGAEFDVVQDNEQIRGIRDESDGKHYINCNVINNSFIGIIGYRKTIGSNTFERRILGYLGESHGVIHVMTVGTDDDDHHITEYSITNGSQALNDSTTEAKGLPSPQSA